MMPAETLPFQAETKHLLDLMIHSLYTAKDIFLRELISNASDALDRLRFESLVNPQLIGDDSQLAIHLDVDRQARTLTISDSGVGMSREEVIANIGSIAKSGTREFREKVKEGASEQQLAEFIGQFGVGFYSAFMVADQVTLVTRRAGETTATKWESSGDGQYVITPTSKPSHGTAITLHLKPVDPENGLEDFTDKWILARTVKKYSDFISYPIIYHDQVEEVARDEAGQPQKDAPPTITVEEKTLNTMKPLWARAPSEVTENEYVEFYKHLTYEMSEPLHTLALKAEGRLEYQALLFIPQQAPRDLFYHASEAGLRLYAKGVLIMEQCADLLPRYLRFVKGIVDAHDLPLNISRQMLQQDRHITQIRKWLVKKILEALQHMHEHDGEKYLLFWKQFGRALKEGVSSDYDNKEKVTSLLLFESSHDPEQLTTLKGYVERLKDDQQEIFYLTGESRSVVEHSPHLEAYLAKGYEVLYLVEPVDELLVQSMSEYEGKRLKSVRQGIAKLGSEEENEETEKALKQMEEESAELFQAIQKSLDKYIKDVRLSRRLTSSPVCLVGTEMDYSPQLERLLQMGQGAGPKQRRIMELNHQHAIFTKLKERFEADHNEETVKQYAELLHGYALLAEGSELPDPVRFNQLVAELMVQTL